jgi:predicted metal-binding protein
MSWWATDIATGARVNAHASSLSLTAIALNENARLVGFSNVRCGGSLWCKRIIKILKVLRRSQTVEAVQNSISAARPRRASPRLNQIS